MCLGKLQSLSLVTFLLLGFCLVATGQGQEFRVDTEVFIGKDKEPAVETLTLFTGGLIYDFLLQQPEEITLFDPVRQGFTLLDPARRVRCSVSTQEVLNYSLALDAHALEGKDPLFQFAAKPQFETTVEEYESSGQTLTRVRLAGKPLEYLVVARRPEKPEAVRAFRNFADWYARLNAMRPGNLPPGARLEVNRELAERDLIPLEVTRTITSANPLDRKVEARSRHLVNWALSREDRKKIERVGTMLIEYSSVSFDVFRSGKEAGPPAGAKQARR